MGSANSSSSKISVERFASPEHEYNLGWEPAPGDVFRFKLTCGNSATEDYQHGYLLIKPNGYAYLDEERSTMFVKREQGISYIEGNSIFQVCSREKEIDGHYLSVSSFGFAYPAGVWPKETQKTVFQVEEMNIPSEPTTQELPERNVEGIFTLSIGKEKERKLCVSAYDGCLNFSTNGKTMEVRFEPVKMNEETATFEDYSNIIGSAVTYTGGTSAGSIIGYLAAHGVYAAGSGGAVGLVATYGLFVYMSQSKRKRTQSELLPYQQKTEKTDFEGPGFNVGIIGPSGAGKSTFVNAMRNLHEDEEGAAKVSAGVEGTKDPEPYDMQFVDQDTILCAHRFFGVKERIFTIWDIPGHGTPANPEKTYIEDKGLLNYDCIVLIENERIHQKTLELYFALKKADITVFVVRNKFDAEFERVRKRERRQSGTNARRTLGDISKDHATTIRDKYNEKLFPDDNVYLVSSDYDDKLKKYLSPDFAKLWKDILLSCLDNRQVPPLDALNCFKAYQQHQDFWPEVVHDMYKENFPRAEENFTAVTAVDLGV